MKSVLLALGLSLPLVAQQAAPAPAAPTAPVAAPAPAPAAAPASAPAAAPAPKAAPAPVAADKVLDDGLLHTQWFGPGVAFAKGDDVDYF